MGKNVKQVEEKLLKGVSKEFKVDTHHWLILDGRSVLPENPNMVALLSKACVSLRVKLSEPIKIWLFISYMHS